MPMPRDLGVIDCMLSIPSGNPDPYGFLRPLLLDAASPGYRMPVEFLFKDLPQLAAGADPVAAVLHEMDRFGIERALVPVDVDHEPAKRALGQHPDRFSGTCEVDPNRGMDGVRRLVALREELGIVAATAFPCGLVPQVPIDDRRFFPLYAKCVELGIPICVCCGVPGPRVPMAPQKVERIDAVCAAFPELVFVMRHGAEPWTKLAVKLMLRWPNLYYSTSAFAPKHYPEDIVRYANTRGADKVIYAGYFPMGLSLERIFKELPEVPFRDAVWPKFLRENALRVFGLKG